MKKTKFLFVGNVKLNRAGCISSGWSAISLDFLKLATSFNSLELDVGDHEFSKLMAQRLNTPYDVHLTETLSSLNKGEFLYLPVDPNRWPAFVHRIKLCDSLESIRQYEDFECDLLEICDGNEALASLASRKLAKVRFLILETNVLTGMKVGKTISLPEPNSLEFHSLWFEDSALMEQCSKS